MKNRIITILFLFNLFLLLIGCTLFCGDRLNDDWYVLRETSAAVGDTIDVVYMGAPECDPDLHASAHGHFGGLSTFSDEIFSITTIDATANQFSSQSCTFIVPPKAVSSNFLFYKDFFIEYPKTLTYETKEGNKVTVKSEKPFFNGEYFSKEKAQLLLDNGYPLVWLDGEAPTKAKSHVLENWSPLEGSDNYVLSTITKDQVTFIIPDWFKGGNIHILNENGYIISIADATPLSSVKIAKADFDDILSKITADDQIFLNSKYQEKDGFYCLKEDAISLMEDFFYCTNNKTDLTYQNIKRILRKAGYFDTHVPCIEPDPLDPHAFFSSKEKLTVD